MNIVLPGGTGQIGTFLARAFSDQGHNVTVIGRNPSTNGPWNYATWDGISLGPWINSLADCDVLINLAGRSVNCRYTAKNRHDIVFSRVHTTKLLGKALQQINYAPKVWLQSSTATIYSHRYDAPNDEYTGIIGGNEPTVPYKLRTFSVDVAKQWEEAAQQSAPSNTRLVLMRSALVLSPDKGGIFDMLLTMVRLGIGGTVAGGQQYISWVHQYDFINILNFLIEHDLEGVVNIAAPDPLPQAAFMRILRRAWGQPIGLPATKWMAAIGALVLQSETELLFKSRRVVSTRLPEAGYEFQFNEWYKAAAELCQRAKQQKQPLFGGK